VTILFSAASYLFFIFFTALSFLLYIVMQVLSATRESLHHGWLCWSVLGDPMAHRSNRDRLADRVLLRPLLPALQSLRGVYRLLYGTGQCTGAGC